MSKETWRRQNRDPATFVHWWPPAWPGQFSRWEHKDEYPNLWINLSPLGIFYVAYTYLTFISGKMEFSNAIIAGLFSLVAGFTILLAWCNYKAWQYRRSQRNASLNSEQ